MNWVAHMQSDFLPYSPLAHPLSIQEPTSHLPDSLSGWRQSTRGRTLQICFGPAMACRHTLNLLTFGLEAVMKTATLLFLRVSVALLVLIWGIDKIVNVDHAIRVSNTFYFGLLSAPGLVPILGVAQCIVAILGLIGLYRSIVDPIIALINLGSLIGVRMSIIDPWGWFIEGTNTLFFPSLAVFAACLLLIAFRSDESLVLDRRRVVDVAA